MYEFEKDDIILDLIRKNNTITVEQIAQATGVYLPYINQEVQRLKRQGKIFGEETAPDLRWIILDE